MKMNPKPGDRIAVRYGGGISGGLATFQRIETVERVTKSGKQFVTERGRYWSKDGRSFGSSATAQPLTPEIEAKILEDEAAASAAIRERREARDKQRRGHPLIGPVMDLEDPRLRRLAELLISETEAAEEEFARQANWTAESIGEAISNLADRERCSGLSPRLSGSNAILEANHQAGRISALWRTLAMLAKAEMETEEEPEQ